MIDKYKKIFGKETIREFKIKASTIRKKREEYLYEVIGTLNTTFGLFRVEKSGWEILSVVDEVVDDLKRQVIERKERIQQSKMLRNA